MHLACTLPPSRFFGTRVVRCAFVLAMLGWGTGFYGPPIYLAEVAARTGWPLTRVSAAVTVHFLVGALVAANLPRLHARLGLAVTTTLGAVMTGIGVFGWAVAWHAWHLFAAALLSGAGWVAMGAVAVNAIVARWYVGGRPGALARAYNGASVGGAVFSPLWVALIHAWGFPAAAAVVGAAMVLIVAAMSRLVFSRTPESLGQALDGGTGRHGLDGGAVLHEKDGAAIQASGRTARSRPAAGLPGGALWRDRAFQTLAAGMALGLFAQIGLLAHLFTQLAPIVGAQEAGILMGACTACAILGRTVAVRALAPGGPASRLAGAAPGGTAPFGDRRLVAAASYGVQAAGAAILLAAWGGPVWPIAAGVALFGMGIGNATSLPPAIAQADFAAADVPRVVALIVAIAQASYAFAPAIFGILLYAGQPGSSSTSGHTALLFSGAVAIQIAAAAMLLAGRRAGGHLPSSAASGQP
ncbi:hypothetical protein AKI39_05855 [Bordetella sp. H567]|uniref:MFS transporter n=1 Tax=Bordetella sp. H567 TaxID=1697043 RepID=UPI00081CCF10|nr:MFS transporter [Bordetella sp. H567]AOB30316.1 hypothetical protein AKI39_05855 [Bordetella sp. H567]